MDSSFLWVSDLKLWLQILERGDYVNVDESGCLYRRHSEADSVINCPVETRMTEYLSLVEELGQWSVLSTLQAVRHGGADGRARARKNLWKACSATGLKRTLMALADTIRMRSPTRRTK